MRETTREPKCRREVRTARRERFHVNMESDLSIFREIFNLTGAGSFRY